MNIVAKHYRELIRVNQNRTILFFAILFPIILFSQYDTTRTYFNDSSTYIECTYLNGIMHGYCKSFYENGSLKEFDSVVNGKAVLRQKYSRSGELIAWYKDNGRRIKFKDMTEEGVLLAKGRTSWRKTKHRNWNKAGKLTYFHRSRKGYGINCSAPEDTIYPDSILIKNGWCFWNDQAVFWKNGTAVDSNGMELNTKYSFTTILFYENGQKAQLWEKKRKGKKVHFRSWDINGILIEDGYR
ncbi:MAG: hypothetical protein EP338_03050 [Bacteroidetes bacterium]|nr:MAG: hypothetical protein EP338_03050 [Bacteroidota bacterium]